jgi:hypothetical protein
MRRDRYDPLPNPKDQPRHNRIALDLLNSSAGDLILDGMGDLCRRETWDEDYRNELPWAQHRVGERLAEINRFGWRLTPDGAEYILSNEIFLRKDLRFLKEVRTGLR